MSTKGPTVSLKLSCSDCVHCVSIGYTNQGDSGSDVYCGCDGKMRIVGDTTWTTPEWCPLRAEAIKALPDVAQREKEIQSLSKWIDDLQSGMYINCVYCGHRYGPRESTPATMADALKAHIAQCEKHPMARLLTACLVAFHSLKSIKAVREGIPDAALQEHIEFIERAILSAQVKS